MYPKHFSYITAIVFLVSWLPVVIAVYWQVYLRIMASAFNGWDVAIMLVINLLSVFILNFYKTIPKLGG